MIYKINVTDKTVCIGSFSADAEVTGQFQYTGKKGNVYMFYIQGVTDAGVSLTNVVTGEIAVVPVTAVKKIKALEGSIVTVNKYDTVERMDVINALINGDEVSCLNSELTDIKVVGMSMVNKQSKFILEDTSEYPIESMYKFVETIQFGA